MPNRQKIFIALGLLIILFTIPLTLFIVNRRQQLRSDAALDGPDAQPPAAGGEGFCREELDLAMVVDMSSSMLGTLGDGSGKTKRDAAISGITSFLNQIDLADTDNDGKRDRIAVVQFNEKDKPKIISPLSSDKTALIASLQNLKGATGTDLVSGIEKADEVLTLAPTPIQPRHIVILSDGADNINSISELIRVSGAAKGRGNATISAIFLGDIDGNAEDRRGYTLLHDHVVSTPENILSANLSVQELEQKFAEIAGVIKECPCSFISTMQVENVDQKGVPLTITPAQFFGRTSVTGKDGKSSSEFYDLYEKPETGKAQYKLMTTNLPTNQRDTSTNSIELKTIPSGMQIVERFCVDNGTGKACPTGLVGDQAISGKVTTDAISNFKLVCDANVTYGWRVKEIQACMYTGTAEIRATNGQVLPGVRGFEVASTADGQAVGSALEIYDAQVNRNRASVSVDPLPDNLKNAQTISATLSQKAGTDAQKYTVVGSFCTNNKGGTAGCPANSGQNTDTLTSFDLECNQDLTYGWTVEAKTCPFNATIQVRDADTNQVLDRVGAFGWKSMLSTGAQTMGNFPPDDATRPEATKAEYSVSTEFLDVPTGTTADVSLNPRNAQYEIASVFCVENDPTHPGGCPAGMQKGDAAINPADTTIDDLAVSCNTNITYGWRVRKRVSSAVCYNLTCRNEDELKQQGIATAPLVPCSIGDIGREVGICDVNNCNTGSKLCERKPVEQDNGKTCSTAGRQDDPACVESRTVCDGKACVKITNPQDPRYNNSKTCTTPSSESSACTVKVCTALNTCTVLAWNDTTQQGKKTCTDNSGCGPDPVTYSVCNPVSEQCEQKTASNGVIPPEAVDCQNNPEVCAVKYVCNDKHMCARSQGTGADSCTSHDDCLKTYYGCDKNTCVLKVGDKQDSCDPDPAKRDCKDPETPNTGTPFASIALTSVVLVLLLAGVRLIF